jgi:hypothetical protein
MKAAGAKSDSAQRRISRAQISFRPQNEGEFGSDRL